MIEKAVAVFFHSGFLFFVDSGQFFVDVCDPRVILKDRSFRQKTVAVHGVVDNVCFVDRKVHIEDNIEFFVCEVALAGDLEVNVNKQFQTTECVFQFCSQGITVCVKVHITEIDRRSAGVPQVRVLCIDSGRKVEQIAALFVQEGHDSVDI